MYGSYHLRVIAQQFVHATAKLTAAERFSFSFFFLLVFLFLVFALSFSYFTSGVQMNGLRAIKAAMLDDEARNPKNNYANRSAGIQLPRFAVRNGTRPEVDESHRGHHTRSEAHHHRQNRLREHGG